MTTGLGNNLALNFTKGGNNGREKNVCKNNY